MGNTGSVNMNCGYLPYPSLSYGCYSCVDNSRCIVDLVCLLDRLCDARSVEFSLLPFSYPDATKYVRRFSSTYLPHTLPQLSIHYSSRYVTVSSQIFHALVFCFRPSPLLVLS